MTNTNHPVRQCPDCQAPAVILSVEWNQYLGGTPSGSVREYQCQACGARIKEPTVLGTIGRLVSGTLFIGFLGLGLILFVWEVRNLRRFGRCKPVPGAPVPERRFPAGPSIRRCVCGHLTRVTRVTRTTYGGIPIGVEIEHRCDGCRRTHLFWPVGQMVAMVLLGLALSCGAAALVVFVAKWWAYGIAALLGLLGLLTLIVVAWGIVDRFRMPVVSVAQAQSTQGIP